MTQPAVDCPIKTCVASCEQIWPAISPLPEAIEARKQTSSKRGYHALVVHLEPTRHSVAAHAAAVTFPNSDRPKWGGRKHMYGQISGRIPSHIAITGATGGLGRALAEHYAAPGLTLSLSGRNTERLGQVKTTCRSKGATVDAQFLDVTDAEATETWLAARDDALPVDILIASTGLGGAAVVAPPMGESGQLARDIVSTNTFGVINAVTPLLSRMAARRHGHLVLVGSIQAMIGMPQSPAYCASKAAVQIYGDGLRRLVRQHGVRVTNVLPGFIDTPMSQSLNMARPFCWSAEKAARRIARDVARGAPQCIFPWQLRLSIAAQKFLPISVSDWIMEGIARSFSTTEIK